MGKRRLQNERGAAVVEFAIVSVVLLIIVFGVIELGILMFDKHILTNASREGARAGIVMRTPRVSNAAILAKVNEYAEAHMVSFGASSTLSVTVTPNEASRAGAASSGEELEVSVTYPFEFLILSGFGLKPLTLTANTRMRIE